MATGKETSKRKRKSSTSSSQLNRAQQQALDSRAGATVESGMDDVSVASPQAEAVSPGRRRTISERLTRRPVALTREQEYNIIRSDMRRLLMIAGPLFVTMLVLLVFLE